MTDSAKHVFLVEDDELFRDAMTDVLRMNGYSVSTARNGAEALSRLRASPVLPGVVLVDLTMPIMDGPAFYAALRDDPALCGIPVVMMSAHADDAATGRPLEAQGYLRKPFTIETLLEATRSHCA